jgi:hypothetical protein
MELADCIRNCLYCTPSSAPPPNNLSAHVGLFQYFFVSTAHILHFLCHLRCGDTKQADSFHKWACSCPARPPRWAKFAVSAENRNRPRAGAARPGSKLAHRSAASASCGPERERNPTRRTGSASFSSPRFASAPSSFPTPPHGNGRARRLPPRAVLLSSGRRTPTWGRWPVAAQAALRRRSRRCRLRPRAAADA